MQGDVWTARATDSELADEMVGYAVEGRDGTIGKVDRVNYGRTCVVVSTSRLFGKKYVIPIGAVERIDDASEAIFVDLSKEEVEGSPEYDDDAGFDDQCEATTGSYYADVLARRASAR